MDITEICKLIIELVFAVIGLFFIPWLKANLNSKKLATTLKWVEIAVNAADQIYEVSQGPEKKSFVVAFLKERGYEMNEKELDLAIESAVLKLHKQLTDIVA